MNLIRTQFSKNTKDKLCHAALLYFSIPEDNTVVYEGCVALFEVYLKLKGEGREEATVHYPAMSINVNT